MSSLLDAILKLSGKPSLEALKSADGLSLVNVSLTSVPESIEQLTNLMKLHLGKNKLFSLPESIGLLTNLTELWLSDNQISSLPESIGQLTNLTGLGLGHNQLPSIPESIGELRKLELLGLWHNKLSLLPESIGQLNKLTVLNINNNRLLTLPTSIGQLTTLTLLGLWINKLSSVPESIGQLTNLKELPFNINNLSLLPDSIGQLTNLTGLWIYDNPITELPESITRLKNLQEFLLVHKNELTVKRAPIGITALPWYSNTSNPHNSKMNIAESLKKLKLYSNHINENLTDISSLIGKWKACDRINISNNKISTLPDQLGTLTDLCDFNIANNMFATFPDVLLKMSWLTSLNIAGNSLIELPEGITKLAKLASLVIKDSNGKITIQHAPVNISTLPCYSANADLKKLTPPVPVTAPVQLPEVKMPAELQQFVLSAAPTFNKTKEDTLGEGGQAIVYKGTFEGKPVAIKDISPDAESMKYAADEVILTKKIPHQNIVNIIGVYLCPQGMLIVMELGSDSLKGMIDKRKSPLTPFEIVTFGSQIAGALNYCVSQNPKQPIHHRDLKTENVLIVNSQAKLADFGLAHTRVRTGQTRASRSKSGAGADGTKHWQGPEIYSTVCKGNTDEEARENGGHRGELSDVYAVGLILWSMATGKYPFIDKPSDQISLLLLQGERPEILADVHPTLAHIIRACWRQNYKLRPRFSSISDVLTRCGAGNLDAVPKEYLQQLVPIRYSPIKDMFYGELYEYLTEQGVPQSLANKLRNQQFSGALFMKTEVEEFIKDFSLSIEETQQLVSLQTLAPILQKQELVPQVPIVPTSPPTEKKSVIVKSEPSTPETKPHVSQPTTGRPTPPKPIEEMDTDELVAYLRGQPGILDSFLNGLQQDEVNGEGFLRMLNEKILAQPPFNLKGLQLRGTLGVIEEIKLM